MKITPMRILFCLVLLVAGNVYAVNTPMREEYNSLRELSVQCTEQVKTELYNDVSIFVPEIGMSSRNGSRLLLQLDAETITSHLASELEQIVGSTDDYKNDMLRVLKEFADFFETECNVELQNVLKLTTDFLYCWGFVGYYCFDKDIADWNFQKAFEKHTGIALSRENALDLIRKSHSEKAEIFLGNIGEDK